MEHKCRFLLLTRSACSRDLLEALTEVNHSGHGLGSPLDSDYIQFFGLRTCLQLVFSGICTYTSCISLYAAHAGMFVLLCSCAGGCICKSMRLYSDN